MWSTAVTLLHYGKLSAQNTRFSVVLKIKRSMVCKGCIVGREISQFPCVCFFFCADQTLATIFDDITTVGQGESVNALKASLNVTDA